MSRISAIVPARNEPQLQAKIDRFRQRFPTAQWIAVDTSENAPVEGFHHPEISTRAEAMNQGAQYATGDILLFLHADCELPSGALERVTQSIDRGGLGGAFVKRYDPSTFALCLQSALLNFMAKRFGRMIVGTNAMFVRKDLFVSWKGFENVPLLEDVRFWDRLRCTGQYEVLRSPVTVSSRRYINFRGWGRIFTNLAVYSLYRLGCNPSSLAKFYGLTCNPQGTRTSRS